MVSTPTAARTVLLGEALGRLGIAVTQALPIVVGSVGGGASDVLSDVGVVFALAVALLTIATWRLRRVLTRTWQPGRVARLLAPCMSTLRRDRR